MRIRFLFLLPFFVFAALAGLLLVGLQLNPQEVPSPLIGKPAPAFEAPSLADDELRLSERTLAEAGPSLFNVWASWCVACRHEHPLLMSLSRDADVSIFGLNYKDDADDARAWLAQHGNPYVATAFDPQGQVGLDWGVYGVPETFLIDAAGVVRYKHIGPLTTEAVERELLPRLRALAAEDR